MTTKTTFEDRLLAELRREIEVRGAAGPAKAVAARRSPFAGVLTGRRLALTAGACAVTGLVLVLVPGSPGESPAYAVERHGDGSVTLTLTKIAIGQDAQRRLAERLRAEGIHVTIDNLSFGHHCKQPRGTMLAGSVGRGFIGDEPPEEGSVPVGGPTDPAFHRHWQVTLHPGDSLGMENTSRKDGKPGLSSESFYAIKGKITPCEPESQG
ncbi:hypothetical protein GCM10010313_52640 [Streptomyces violarus]|uniref:Uncharacterized protein n=1 Tax=Streptomyces violarus TaxID=67380 RepID=A0A7W5F367_9ACTN|nr:MULTISPECIES: hypothetical protein [Streptomyces]MBB3078244.1 hypothetical protein [Streptomyces violarus]WRT99605.1 hypothetical protein VJ737_18745 [Streptomyces sp. CGMCC 4.1772]GHD20303.1 hypothetical protein GCM10010313_52640 [Streptomyces violarus]